MIQSLLPLLLTLQEGVPTSETDGGGGGAPNPLGGFMVPIVIIGIFYLLVIRPESKKRKQQQEMLDALGKGDDVVTTSGFHARVVQVQDGVLTLQLADGVRVKAERWAVQGMAGGASEPTETPDASA